MRAQMWIGLVVCMVALLTAAWVRADWIKEGQAINGEVAGNESGLSVALSSDGSRVAIGAPWNDGSGDYYGHVQVYDYYSTIPATGYFGLALLIGLFSLALITRRSG